MWRFAVLIAAVSVVVSCSPGDTEATNHKCATDIYPSYNPKVLEQCMDSASSVTVGSRRLARRPAT